jgi:hypothetical protein
MWCKFGHVTLKSLGKRHLEVRRVEEACREKCRLFRPSRRRDPQQSPASFRIAVNIDERVGFRAEGSGFRSEGLDSRGCGCGVPSPSSTRPPTPF